MSCLEMDNCLLCTESIQQPGKPTNEVRRGIDALHNASELRGDTAIFEHLKSITSLKVHSECRKNYTPHFSKGVLDSKGTTSTRYKSTC